MRFKAPKGTYDVLPEKAEKWEFLEEAARSIFKIYGYRPIETPIFEATELFARGIGEATDIVQKEMYTFTDKGGRSITLRPEGTAPIVRAHEEHGMSQWPQPVKLYYAGSMFRYERPQAGRYRQFYQLGVEALGSNDPALDAEVIILLLEYCRSVGVKEMDLLISSMGCSECRSSYIEALKDFARERISKLCPDCARRFEVNPLRLFDCKNPACGEVLAGAPKMIDYLCDGCRVHFESVKGHLGKAGVGYKIDPTLVRGLDYYTRTTFEVQSGYLGAQNAIGGGGRYDGLAEELGGAPAPGIGFALGIERLAMAVEAESGKIPGEYELDVFVVAVDDSVRVDAFMLAQRLRGEGLVAEMDYLGRSIKGQLKLADKLGARFAAFVGPEELAAGLCRLKNMVTGEQEDVPLGGAPAYLADKVFEEPVK
ncbi:MAG: histidine--tRNA ligase [Actinobacteria bacterium]|nr:histidine--tRNA ligase [Actinomycetota bacterium]